MPGLLYKNFRINFPAFLFVLIFTSVCCVIILLTAIIGGKEFVIENDGLFAMIGLYYVIFMMPSLTNTFLFEPDEGKTAGSPSCSIERESKTMNNEKKSILQ